MRYLILSAFILGCTAQPSATPIDLSSLSDDEVLDVGSDLAYEAIELVDDEDPRKLEEPLLTFYAVYHGQGIIDNGGLCYFFENDFPHNPPYSFFSDAYRRIGCLSAADAIDAAAKSFGTDHPERFVDLRRAYIEKNYDDDRYLMPAWDESICGDETIFPSLIKWYRNFKSSERN